MKKAKIRNYTSRGEYKRFLKFDRFKKKKHKVKNYLRGGVA